MGVRPRKNGYQGAVRIIGHEAQYKTFKTAKEAKRWVADKEREIGERTVSNPRILIDELVDRYVREIAPKRKMAESHLKHDIPSVKRQFKGMRMADLHGRGLIDWVRKQTIAGSSCHWHIARLRGVLRQAEHHWDIAVPWADIKRSTDSMLLMGTLKLAKARDRRVTDTELGAVKAQISKKSTHDWSGLFDFCVASAMRIGEVCRIRWADFDEEAHTVIVRDRKHPTKKFGNHKVVPLLNGAFEIIMRQRKVDDRIFSTGKLYASKVFHTAAVKAGIEDLVLHDLRHEGISRLFELGFQIQEVALVSGHTEWKTLARYTHLKPAALVQRERELRAG